MGGIDVKSRRRQVHLRHCGRPNARSRKLALAITGSTPGVRFDRRSVVDVLDQIGIWMPNYEAMTYRTTLPRIREKLKRIGDAWDLAIASVAKVAP